MTKWDKVLIVFILCMSLLGMYAVQAYTSNSDNLYLVIEVDGKAYKKISLDKGKESQVIDIKTPYGQNVVNVENRKVRFSEASCKDQLCVKTGWLVNANQISICLPNHVSIRLIENNTELDIISY